ncbi:MAG: HU family DNA-binding protein [Fibrobacter sp.]|nr:HU family DNA-binding protein [Fibrobacter sp.]
MSETEILKEISATVITCRKEIKRVIEEYVNCIKDELANGKTVRIKDLGTFTPKTKKARKARNPKTGEEIEVPEKKTIKFKPSATFLEVLNNPNSELWDPAKDKKGE